MSTRLITVTAQPRVVVRSDPDGVRVVRESAPVRLVRVLVPGPPGADGSLTGAITAAYTVQAGKVLPGGWFRDQVSGLGTVQLSLTDSAGVAYPVARYFADAAAGALLQVKWAGGVRVYRRAAGVASLGFDLTYGTSYEIPATADSPADTLPAVGTAVRVTVLPAAPHPTPADIGALALTGGDVVGAVTITGSLGITGGVLSAGVVECADILCGAIDTQDNDVDAGGGSIYGNGSTLTHADKTASRDGIGLVTHTTLDTAGAVSIDLATNTSFVQSLTDNVTLSLANEQDGHRFTVYVRGQASGYAITWWSGIKWANGAAPALPTVAGRVLPIGFVRLASGEWLGLPGQQCY